MSPGCDDGIQDVIFKNKIGTNAGNKGYQGNHMKMTIPSFLPAASIPPEGQAAVTTKEVLSLLEHHQTLLFEAVGELQELQELEQEKQQIAAEISSKDNVVRAFAKRARDAQQVLEGAVEEFADLKKGKHRSSVPVAELVSYAHRISYTTFAPPEHGAGLAALHGALPPAPQDEHMRASQLYRVHELDLGFTQAFTQSQAPAVTSPEEGEAVKVEPVMPPGWQPGMPVQLPSMLPPMPDGWKPGDPIPLPPLPTLPIPPDGMLPKAQPPAALIHVPHVTLDLNPELEEEYSSEYGSGSESDDDDD